MDTTVVTAHSGTEHTDASRSGSFIHFRDLELSDAPRLSEIAREDGLRGGHRFPSQAAYEKDAQDHWSIKRFEDIKANENADTDKLGRSIKKSSYWVLTTSEVPDTTSNPLTSSKGANETVIGLVELQYMVMKGRGEVIGTVAIMVADDWNTQGTYAQIFRETEARASDNQCTALELLIKEEWRKDNDMKPYCDAVTSHGFVEEKKADYDPKRGMGVFVNITMRKDIQSTQRPFK